jgi:hypothetical protein
MVVVATDANFLKNPIPIDAGANAGNSNSDTAPIVPGGLRVSVAERFDVIIDFTEFPAGSKLYLKENRTMVVGNPSPDPLPPGLNIGNVLLQFNVVNREAWFPKDTPPIPAQLCEYPDLLSLPTDVTFEWQFVRDPACPPGTVRASSGSEDQRTTSEIQPAATGLLAAHSMRNTRPTAFHGTTLKSGSLTTMSAALPGHTRYTYTSKSFAL